MVVTIVTVMTVVTVSILCSSDSCDNSDNSDSSDSSDQNSFIYQRTFFTQNNLQKNVHKKNFITTHLLSLTNFFPPKKIVYQKEYFKKNLTRNILLLIKLFFSKLFF